MPSVKVGVQAGSFRLPLRRALEAAARSGADGVELDLRGELPAGQLGGTALRELRKLLDDLRLRLSAVAFPTRGGLADAQGLDRRLAALDQAMRVGYQLGSRVLVCAVGTLPGPGDDAGRDALHGALEQLSRAGERSGVLVALAPGTASGAELAALLGALPEGVLGANLNPAELIAAGHGPLEAIEALGQRIWHVHATDAVRDLATRRVVEVDLGRGAADWPALLGALEERDYRGWITAARGDCDDPAAALADAVAYLRAP